MRIAYDFDGVFIPDFDKIPGLGGLYKFYEMTQHVRPIFEPEGAYTILTGRLAVYQHFTESYLDKFLTNKPKELFHGRGLHQKPHEYKETILNANTDIAVYVESDLFTVNHLREHVECEVIHFSDFIREKLRLSSYPLSV